MRDDLVFPAGQPQGFSTLATTQGETRTFFRRTGGILHEQGKTTVFSDCPLARAWWRCRIAEEVAAHGTLTRDDAHFALRANHQAWERLAMLSVKQLVIINQPIARATVVAGLPERLRNGGKIGPADINDEAQVCARAGLRVHHGCGGGSSVPSLCAGGTAALILKVGSRTQ